MGVAGWVEDGGVLVMLKVATGKVFFCQHLKVSNLLDSLIVAGNSLQIVGSEKLKERLRKLAVHERMHKTF